MLCSLCVYIIYKLDCIILKVYNQGNQSKPMPEGAEICNRNLWAIFITNASLSLRGRKSKAKPNTTLTCEGLSIIFFAVVAECPAWLLRANFLGMMHMPRAHTGGWLKNLLKGTPFTYQLFQRACESSKATRLMCLVEELRRLKWFYFYFYIK